MIYDAYVNHDERGIDMASGYNERDRLAEPKVRTKPLNRIPTLIQHTERINALSERVEALEANLASLITMLDTYMPVLVEHHHTHEEPL